MFAKPNSHILACSAAILLVAAAAWAAGDPWKDKSFNQWDDKDLQKVFTASPWAKVLTVENTWADVKEPEHKDLSQIPGQTAGVSKGRYSSGQEPTADTRGPQAVFDIYWLSSRTMRGAVARKGVLHGGQSEAEAEKYVAEPQEQFQVVIQGKDMKPFTLKDEKTYAALAWLQLKSSKSRIAPSEVKYERTPDGQIDAAIFQFPKKTPNGEATIAPNEKGVEFSCKVAESTIKVTFEPQKMADKHGPDL
jgi:hypothetical protein